MTARELAREFRPRDRGVTEPGWRMGRVSDVLGTDRPPMLLVGDGDRPVRITGDISDYHPGDVVTYLERSGGAIVLDRVPVMGIGDPLTDPDDAEPLEDWHEIGATDQPAFQNSWTNYGDPYDTAAFYQAPDYWVRLKGVARSGTDNTAIFTLPEGYRPPVSFVFRVHSASAVAGVVVETSGVVRKYVGGGTTHVSLDGITFPTRRNLAAWLHPVDMSGWGRSLTATSNLVTVYVRDDGWCWMTGVIESGTSGAVAMLTPEPARTVWGDIHASIAFGVGRHDHGGKSLDRGVGRWIHRTGGNGEHSLGGLNWFSHRAPDELMTAVSHQNGWTDLAAGWRPCSYLRDHLGVVHLMGVANGASKTSNVIATLPAGYRPAKKHIYVTLYHGDVVGRVDVHADGTVEAVSGLAGYASLADITFRAMQ